jgi:fumarate hydratase class II
LKIFDLNAPQMGRIEMDSLGEIEIPDDRLYGPCTERTLRTCPTCGHRVPMELIAAILTVKRACAIANGRLGKLSAVHLSAILGAIGEIQTGKFDDNFVTGIFQNGAGTSINMNVNEVIAAVATRESAVAVHSRDHVNMSQSTNDVIPSAMNIGCSVAIDGKLTMSLRAMLAVLTSHADRWNDLVKIGRTHMQDAVPMTLGQEFSAYARQVEKCIDRCRRAMEILAEIPIGGTAVGTGLNAPHGFSKLAVAEINAATGLHFTVAKNKFCEQSSKDSVVELTGILNAIAAPLAKIARDLRILSSGPMAGIAELELPVTQEGSSIMPGKINPAMCEMLIQACYYVNGMMLTAMLGASNGELQVNTAMPVTAYALLDSIAVLSQCIDGFSRFCLKELRPREKIIDENVKKSPMLATSVAPLIGYATAASVVRDAIATDRPIAAVLKERHLLDSATVDDLCDPRNMANVNHR